MSNDCLSLEELQAAVSAKLTKGENDKAKSTANNYLLVFKHDPVLTGIIRRNEPTGKLDIADQMWWHRDGPPLTDVDLKYLILYCEETYGLSAEKKIENAVAVIANENRFHPIRDYLEQLQWDGQERIRNCLHHFLGADTDKSFGDVTLAFRLLQVLYQIFWFLF